MTATHVDTGTVRTTVTSASGTYVMPALPESASTRFQPSCPASARLRRRASGSPSAIPRAQLHAEGGDGRRTNHGAGRSRSFDTKKSELFGTRRAAPGGEPAVNGRDWLGLVSLVPGARGNPAPSRPARRAADMAKYQVDGVDVTTNAAAARTRAYSMENIEEFKVETNRYDASTARERRP